MEEDEQSSIRSFTTAAQDIRPRASKMDAVLVQMSGVFKALVEVFQEQQNGMEQRQTEQLNEIGQNQAAIIRETEAIKARQHHFEGTIGTWQAALDAKAVELQREVDATAYTTSGLDAVLKGFQAEKTQLQGLVTMVDAISEQHNTLQTKVHALSFGGPPATCATQGGELAVEHPDRKLEANHRVTKLKIDPGRLRAMATTEQAAATATGLVKDAFQPASLGNDSVRNTSNAQEAPRGPARPPAWQAASFLHPPRSRFTRDHSVASSVTMCGSDSVEAPILSTRPPPSQVVMQDIDHIHTDPRRSYDSDEIVVAERKKVTPSDDRPTEEAHPPSIASPDHAAFTRRPLDSIGMPPPKIRKCLTTTGSEDSASISIADLHKRFGMRSDVKENIGPTTKETDDITYEKVRRSGRAPKRKVSHEE